MKDYGPYGNEAREHLKRLRPKMFQDLQKSWKLDAYLKDVQNQTSKEILDLQEQGFQTHEAEELVLPRYVYLPAESDQPDLMESNPQTPETIE
jgi:hypothetical protein